ncbi:MAG: Uma2 family endonuclease [Ktedonobacteraceae bacterium]|nr:Uma2 family endonuclease [Ktedonobacteraceae bacterium]
MVAHREPRYISVDEWRELERANPDVKYEYIDGQVYLMSGGSLAHARIGSNVVRAIEDALGSKPCYAYNSDASVRLSETRYAYPDASVSCDPRDQPTTEQMQVQAPRVVVEVLSDSTEGKDRLRKANFYHACPTIQEYVLIVTKYQAVEVQRRAGDEWTLHLFGSDDEVELASLGIWFPVAALYRGTAVPMMPQENISGTNHLG